jgi:hypothetical protein
MQVVFARGPSQLQTVCATRALFEHVVRHMVLGNPKISLQMGSLATNIRLDDQSAAVTGEGVAGYLCSALPPAALFLHHFSCHMRGRVAPSLPFALCYPLGTIKAWLA